MWGCWPRPQRGHRIAPFHLDPSWNSTVCCTKISLNDKNSYTKTERGCGILKRLLTAATQETRPGHQESPGTSSTGEERHCLRKQLIND
jgi:hypothetical protein